MNNKGKVNFGEIIFSIFVVLVIAFAFEPVKNFLINLIGQVVALILLVIILVLIALIVYWWFNRDEAGGGFY